MDRQKLRRGCTTGTCAQGAAKAAAELLFGIREAEETEVWVELPKGERRSLRIRDIKIEYKETKKFPFCMSNRNKLSNFAAGIITTFKKYRK